MIIYTIILILLGLFSPVWSDMDLPESIQKIDCPIISQNSFMCLSVKWKGNEMLEYALLDKFNGDQNALEGSVVTMEDGKTQDTGSHISVTIHDGKTYATITRPQSEDVYELKLDLTTGAVSLNHELETLPVDYQPDGPEMIPPEDEQEEERGLPGFPRKSPLPEKPMTLKVQIIFDQSFKNAFSDPMSVINQILVEARAFFMHSSLGAMRINLEAVLPHVELGKQIQAFEGNSALFNTTMTPASDKGLNKFGTIMEHITNFDWTPASGPNLKEADLFALFTRAKNCYKCYTGISWSGTVCAMKRGNLGKAFSKRTSIINPKYGVEVAAKTLVHELGHNLGMHHPFNIKGQPKYSKESGEICKGKSVGGLMDYIPDQFRRKWSACSVEDFKTNYQLSILRKGCFCLETCEPTVTPKPTTPKPKKPKPSTCNRYCKKGSYINLTFCQRVCGVE